MILSLLDRVLLSVARLNIASQTWLSRLEIQCNAGTAWTKALYTGKALKGNIASATQNSMRMRDTSSCQTTARSVSQASDLILVPDEQVPVPCVPLELVYAWLCVDEKYNGRRALHNPHAVHAKMLRWLCILMDRTVEWAITTAADLRGICKEPRASRSRILHPECVAT